MPFAISSLPQEYPFISYEFASLPTNTHPIVTRSKANITHKKHLYVNFPILLEPSYYKEARGIPGWNNVMKIEFEAIVRNNTWTLVPKPLDCKPITTKWLYNVKLKSGSSLEKYKSKVVARGYKQQYDIDYLEIFSQ